MQRLTLALPLLAALLVSGCAAPRDQGPPALIVEVNVPPSADTLREDDIIRFFVDSFRDTFRRRGFEGRIDEMYRGERVQPGVPRLTVRLTQWRRTPTGSVECYFSASAQPAQGPERSLGQFQATELSTVITNRWTLAEAFRATAERAADDVWRRLEETQALPSVTAGSR